MAETTEKQTVQCFGRKKTSVAVARVSYGSGVVKIHGCPMEFVTPEILQLKVKEPLELLATEVHGQDYSKKLDYRIRVQGGGYTSRIYAIRQAIAKGAVAFCRKYYDEESARTLKDILDRHDRSLLVADPRRCEPKKFGGRSARARFQKSYR